MSRRSEAKQAAAAEQPACTLENTYETEGAKHGEDQGHRRRIIKRYRVMGMHFDVDRRYSLIDVVGRGAYGVVCAARDEESNSLVAIKKITNAFEHTTYTKRTLREIRLLRLLQHENIIGVRSILPPLHRDGFRDIYVISDLMETDLSSIIKSPQPLTDEHIQFFLYQVLRGLKYLHTSNVVHRDMKPRNLLVNSNCDLKICDFGLARVDFAETSSRVAAMTDYVATRWYRAPEVIMGWKSYTKALDMWSVGCILAELLGRRPIFPGSDSQNQLMLICEYLGKPPRELVAKVRNEAIRSFVTNEIPDTPPIPMHELYPDASEDACDLLTNLLAMDPAKRFTVEQALEHKYLEYLHCPRDEPCGPVISRDEFNFERTAITIEELKQEILHEIELYHQAEPPRPTAEGKDDLAEEFDKLQSK
uniref:Mitogen-activated protein kinase n=1 Tax=Rhizochromulina marina TaxID=1034831 RepID=A0A7S2S2I0_9STRA